MILLKEMKCQNADYYGLIFKCPVGEEVSRCEFRKIRELPIKDRLTYFNALTEKEFEMLIKFHQRCLSVREKKSLFHESQ